MADIENEVINEEGTCENETEESSSIPWLGTSEYTHFVPHEKPRPDFEEIFGLKHHLIKSLDELKDFYEHVFKPNSVLAWDTETTSLNPEQGAKTGDYIEGVICGFSFTQDGKNGYYVPVQHPDYALGYKALKIFYAMIRKSALNLLYNARFDMRFMEFMTPEKYGYIPEEDERIYEFDLSKIKYFDVQGSVWLSDTNVIMPSLKRAEVHFLGWMPPHFEDNFDADTSDEGTEKSKRKKKNIEQNFGFLPAERGYRYASIDALATYQLYLRTKQYYEESRASGKLDNEALYPLMKLENYPIYIDHDYLLSMRGDVLKHIEELKNYLFEKAGREFKINSGRELAKVFMDLGIDLGGRTKLGIMKTDIKSINNYMATHPKNEYLTKLIEYKQLVKFDNSYLETLINISDPEEVKKHPIRFSYNTCRVPTGRLACGGDKKNKFFSPLNYQCLKYDTRVLTKEGLKQIKDINTGDLVWDGEKFTECIQLGYKKKNLIKVSCGAGHYLEASKEHQVYAYKDGKIGWYCLGELTTKDYLSINRKYEDKSDIPCYGFPYEYYKIIKSKDSRIVANNLNELEALGYKEATFGWKKISEIEDIGEDIVYDLYVEESHRFTANGFIVHNSLPKPHSHMYHCHKATPEQIANKEDLAGWIFNDDPEGSYGLVEGQDPHLNVRKAFRDPNNDGVIISVDMCAEAGSPVQSKRGYLGLSELRVGDEILTPNGYKTVIHVMSTGCKKICKINTNGQALYCSEDHPIILEGKQVKASQISKKLQMESFKAISSTNIFEGVSNPTSAYLLGYIYGDGNITRRRHDYLTLNVSSKDKEHLIRITEIFGGDIKLTYHIKNGHSWWSFDIYDSAICNRLFELGVRERKSYVGCELPLDWLGENFRHFIRGLFDSDGYVRIKSKYLDFSFVGHDSYIKKIFELNPERWSYKQKSSLSLLSLKGDFESKKFIYEYLYKDATIWLQRKRDIIDQWYENTFGDLFMNTWDITIDSEDHLYYLNGILSHNCAEEVRVVTNVYHEDNWIDAFNSGEDLHKRTACLIFGEENYCKEARKKAKCISGDSKLYTDQGIINIRDICSTRELGTPIDVNFKLATPEGFCKCSKFIYNGIKETLRFSMSNGDILEVTPDHLVRSNNKWIQAKEFKVGDYIDFESTMTEVNKFQDLNLSYITDAKLKFTKELAYYVGAILGDGNISSKNVYFVSEDSELVQYMSEIIKYYNLGEAYVNISKYTKTTNKPFVRLNCGAKKSRELCKDITLVNAQGHKQFKVPDIILKSPNEVKFAFIQGLFDTDGTVGKPEKHKHTFCLGFCTKSKELAIGCMHILRSLDIACRIEDSYNKSYNKTYYKLKIRATYARKFLELGGFRCLHKQNRLLEWCNTLSFVKSYKKHYKILSIENSMSDVYDLTIENETHSFLANGFVVHNCASFGMLYGSTTKGFNRQFPDMTYEECEDFMNKFRAAVPNIIAGQKEAIRKAKRLGTTYTFFGRPRRLRYYYSSPDRSVQAFGDRTVGNTAIQGAAADILKIMLKRVYDKIFSKYPEVSFIGTIHDEINYLVPRNLISTIVPLILECQTIDLRSKGWPVVLECDLSMGLTFGSLIPFYFKDGEFTPQLEEIKKDEPVTVEASSKDDTSEFADDNFNYLE